MPTYEYACEACESEFEVEQRITDEPLKSCPRCRSRRVKRLISQTYFTLKGGGWYADGYASNSGGKRAGGESKATGASESASPSDTATSEKAKAASATKGEKAVA